MNLFFPALGRVHKAEFVLEKKKHLLMCFEDKMMGFTKMIPSGTKDCIVVDCADGKHCYFCFFCRVRHGMAECAL